MRRHAYGSNIVYDACARKVVDGGGRVVGCARVVVEFVFGFEDGDADAEAGEEDA